MPEPAGPVPIPSNQDFDDFDEQGEHLLSSLHLGPAEDEPTRRGGAASRANSVRFDESALQGSGWSGQNNRHSGEFGPIRPGSGLMMERSLSHKSDGRHSSAGHSVHSVHSGRGSSLGLDTNFIIGAHEDDSPLDVPEPPPSFFVLGPVPSIIRCFLNTNWVSSSVLYADICTGSQRSVVEYSLIKELDFVEELYKDVDGVYRIRLPVYLTEAMVVPTPGRTSTSGSQIPSINVTFEVVGVDQPDPADGKRSIRVFIGSDTLRAHSVDILFSKNKMILYDQERTKVAVPFIRPEDDAVYKHICTLNNIPEKPKLNATATPFVSGEAKPQRTAVPESVDTAAANGPVEDTESQDPLSPLANISGTSKVAPGSNMSESGGESERHLRDASGSESGVKDVPAPGSANGSIGDGSRRESATGIWGSWRQSGSTNGTEGGSRENGPLSGYQPAGRGGRSMKVLKPQKPGPSSSARTGASYEPPPPPRSSGEYRRKSQAAVVSGENGTAHSSRWDAKRSLSTSSDVKAPTQQQSQPTQQPLTPRDNRPTPAQALPRSANPVGGASAFSWMTPSASKGKSATAAE
jgi:hypothetical protein